MQTERGTKNTYVCPVHRMTTFGYVGSKTQSECRARTPPPPPPPLSWPPATPVLYVRATHEHTALGFILVLWDSIKGRARREEVTVSIKRQQHFLWRLTPLQHSVLQHPVLVCSAPPRSRCRESTGRK